MNQNKFKKILKYILVQCLILNHVNVFAASFEVKENINVRARNQDRADYVGTLAPGSIIDIPDRFVIKNDQGKADLQKSLLNWFNSSEQGQAPAAYWGKFDRNKAKFFPVKILHAAKGSSIRADCLKVDNYISLEYLSLRGSLLQVQEGSPSYAKNDCTTTSPTQSSQTLIPPVTPEKALVNNSDNNTILSDPNLARSTITEATVCTDCLTRTNSLGNSFDENRALFYSSLPPKYILLQQKIKMNLSKGIPSDIENRFLRDCKISFNEFQKHLRQEAAKADIPYQILEGIMIQESLNEEKPCTTTNGRTSLGLFQIDASSVGGNQSTNEKLETLKRNGVMNPKISLSMAIRLIKEKAAMLLGPGGFNRDKMSEEDLWAAILSGYNGGQAFVLSAKNRIEQKNKNRTIKKDSHKWENLREEMLTEPYRSVGNLSINIPYVDSIMHYARGKQTPVNTQNVRTNASTNVGSTSTSTFDESNIYEEEL